MSQLHLGFSRPNKWKPFAWLIMKAYGIPYSHSYIKIYSEKYDRFLIYQASGTIVNFMNIETFNEEARVVHETTLDIPQEQMYNIMKFAIDNCGKPYAIKEIFGIAWVRLNQWLRREITNPFSDDNKTLFCSELTSIVLRDCLNIELPKKPGDMSPRDVYELLSNLKAKP